MAIGLNKVFLIGHLGQDPEMRYTPNGLAVTNFSLATSEAYTSKEGNKETRTEWHRIVSFGRLAEICGEYLNKGSMIFVEGRIQTRQWEDRDGNKRWTTEIVANNMQMLDKKRQGATLSDDASLPSESGRSQTFNSQGQSSISKDRSDEQPADTSGKDDIPF